MKIQVHQPNYLEHMTVQNVLFCLENMLFADRKSREQLRQYLSKDGVSSLKRAFDHQSESLFPKRFF
jgi:hypothetical protein